MRLAVNVNNVLVIINVNLINAQKVGPLSTVEECDKAKKGVFRGKKCSEQIPKICGGRSNQQERECLQNKMK